MNKAWNDEIHRQTEVLTLALREVILDIGPKMGAVPLINAVARALNLMTAEMLASIADPHDRKAVRRMMERQLPGLVAAFVSKGTTHSQVLHLDAVKQ